MGMPNKLFSAMVEGVDAGGGFLTTYRVAAPSADTVPLLIGREAETGDWTLVGLEELEFLGLTELESGCTAVTGRSYFSSEP